MQTRPSPSSLVGVVAPQKLDLTDPTLLQYKIQADQVCSILVLYMFMNTVYSSNII